MRTLALVAFALFIAVVTAQRKGPPHGGGGVHIGQGNCGLNEEYSACKSSSCKEATCAKPKVGPACTADCIQGCFCSDGFYRSVRKLCVPKHQCP